MNHTQIYAASYQDPNVAKQTLNNLGYTYDDELSTPESKVFVDKNGNPNIAFRGSKRVVDDWLVSDPLLGLGLSKYDKRHQDSRDLVNKVNGKYGKKSTLYGHSLGGHIASYNADQANHVYINNAGVGINEIGKKLPSNVTHNRNSNDIVSSLATTQSGDVRTSFKPFTNVLDSHKYKDTPNSSSLNIFNRLRSGFFF